MWWKQRDINGNLPDGVTGDPEKMNDVNYFLENSKTEEPEKHVGRPKKEK